jgi:cysteine-rich repeat protein
MGLAHRHKLGLTLLLALAAMLSVLTEHPDAEVRQLQVTRPASLTGGAVIDSLINVRQWHAADGGNDHWYGILAVLHDWLEADSIAQTLTLDTMSGYLATIKNSAENYVIFDSILRGVDPPSSTELFLLGGREVAGSWTWVSGEAFCYSNWEMGEPNKPGVETALAIWGLSLSCPSFFPSGGWNDVAADDAITPLARFWAIVEWGDPDTSNTIVCGNGIVECGEECDDGNFIAGDGCDPACQWEPSVCGNCVVEAGEECDDGNKTNGDGCDATCLDECPILLTGDVDTSGSINSSDIIYLLNYVFLRGGPTPRPCPAAGDVNCTGSVTSADIIYLVNYVFKSGPAPCEPCASPIPC